MKVTQLPSLTGIALLKAMSKLPLKLQYALGRGLGIFLFYVMSKRKNIVDVNLSLCLPELTKKERQRLCKQVFIENGIGVFETGLAWWGNAKQFIDLVKFEGAEHVETALNRGTGVILLGAHYSTLDLGGLLVSMRFPIHAMYRPHNNPILEQYIRKGRLKSLSSLIDRSDFRTVIKTLKKNEIVWYAPDQDFGPNNSVYANFFGSNAATLTATSRLAKFSKATVIPIAHHRLKDGSYRIVFFPPLGNFPAESEIESAQIVNDAIEKGVRINVSQYMWMHRRFKTQTNSIKGYLYKTSNSKKF